MNFPEDESTTVKKQSIGIALSRSPNSIENDIEVTFRCIDSINLVISSTVIFKIHRPPQFIVSGGASTLTINNLNESTADDTIVGNVQLTDIEDDSLFGCSIINFSENKANPFDVILGDITANPSGVGSIAPMQVALRHSFLLNAVSTPSLSFDIRCVDQFDLTGTLPVTVTLVDTTAPTLEWIERPDVTTVLTDVIFKFKLLDGGLACSTCSVTAKLDLTNVTPQKDCSSGDCIVTISANGLGLESHKLSMTLVDSSSNHDTIDIEWRIMDVVVNAYTRSTAADPTIVGTPFRSGIDTLVVSEAGYYSELLDNTVTTHETGVDLGLEVADLFENEVVTIKCSSTIEHVRVTPDKHVYSGSTTIQWFTIEGMEDTTNNPSKTSFGITCVLSSNEASHYGILNGEVMEFAGEKTNVIWPVFDDIIVHYLTTPGSNSTIGTSSVSEDGKFSLTASGNEIITLIPHQEFVDQNDPVFLPGMKVLVGGVELERVCEDEIDTCVVPMHDTVVIVDVNPNGMMFKLPSYSSMCGSDGANCKDSAYQKIILKNPFDIVSDNALTPYVDAIGGLTSCSPHCNAGKSGRGIYFNEECEDFYNGPKCMDYAFSQENCAVRMNGLCVPCPTGSICAGGERMWPAPSFWSFSEQMAPIECDFPAAERCQGFDVATGEAICGISFDGPMCHSCADGYYPGFNNVECLECPEKDLMLYLKPVGIILGVVLIISLVIFGIVTYTTWKSRGISYAANFKHAMWNALWFVFIIQIFIQVGRSSKDYLPKSLESVYTFLNVLQFDFETLHPNCMESDVLFLDKNIMVIGALLIGFITLIGFILFKKMHNFPSLVKMIAHEEKRNKVQMNSSKNLLISTEKMLLILFLILYPMLCNSSVKLTDCMEIDGENKLRSEPSLTCFEGSLAVWNYFGFGTIGIGLFGVISVILIRLNRMLSTIRQNGAPKRSNADLDKLLAFAYYRLPSMWSVFLNSDILASKFYFAFMTQFVVLVITLVKSFSIDVFVTCGVSILCCIVMMICYLMKNPFMLADRWKVIPLVGVLLVSVLASVVNALAHDEMSESDLDIFGNIIIVLLAVVFLIFIVLFVKSIRKRAQTDAAAYHRSIANRKKMFNPHVFNTAGAMDTKETYINPMLPSHLIERSDVKTMNPFFNASAPSIRSINNDVKKGASNRGLPVMRPETSLPKKDMNSRNDENMFVPYSESNAPLGNDYSAQHVTSV
eukprot:TRINITY_DN1251_c0_g1_i4.p1 TRINITY_DN1251_c0_g1~~TRINITY_DN1251_c0_g1_i4.p1  ORF type:complete len:1220 (+),score=399.07 TRINITY_DN1251_c0_g1_i4:3-3662(+)